MLRRRLVLLIAIGAVTAGACAADGPDTAPAATAASSEPLAGSTTSPAPAPGSTAPAPTEPSTTPGTSAPQALVQVAVAPGAATDGFVGAGEDVTGDSCVAEDGVWRAAGTLTNPTAGPVGYRVYVAYLDPDGATLALIEAGTADADAGATTEYLTEFPSNAVDLRCVLRVERVAH